MLGWYIGVVVVLVILYVFAVCCSIRSGTGVTASRLGEEIYLVFTGIMLWPVFLPLLLCLAVLEGLVLLLRGLR
jgi:hypothetical protein